MHIELLSAYATAPGTSGAAGAAVTGDSLTIKNGRGDIDILAVWTDFQNAAGGFVGIVRPSGHDTTRDIRFRTAQAVVEVRNPLGVSIAVAAQETLGITIADSVTAGDVATVCMLMRYADLPGISQRMITPAQLASRMDKLTTIEATITSSAGPGYSGAELITAESALLKANRDYAVLGMNTAAQVAAVTLQGPDTGNVKIGIPGSTDPKITAGWFPLLARAYGEALIPVINSGNAASTYLGVITDENAGSIPISLTLALLK